MAEDSTLHFSHFSHPNICFIVRVQGYKEDFCSSFTYETFFIIFASFLGTFFF